MSEQDDVELGHVCPGLSEAQRAATTAVHQDARPAVLPHEVAARGSLILEFWTARAEDLHFHTPSGAYASRSDQRHDRGHVEHSQRARDAPSSVTACRDCCARADTAGGMNGR